MSMRKTAKFLPVFALGFALSGCMAPPEEPAPLSNSSDTIVTPWGTPGQTPGHLPQRSHLPPRMTIWS